MGTSNSYDGPKGKTPLLPSWLGGNDGGPQPPNPNPQPSPQPPIPPEGDKDRFTNARTNFSRFARSNGSDNASLGRAVSQYVSNSTGGSRTAGSRMGSSRSTSSGLASFLSQVASVGAQQALRNLNLGSLIGKPIEEIFLGLAEHLCPDGGTIDDAIAREAFIETIAELATEGITDFDNMTVEQMQTVFELYATHAIEARLLNDIGNKVIMMPRDAGMASQVQSKLRDFIRRGVSDALEAISTAVTSLSTKQVQGFVDNLYKQSFGILQSLGETAAEENK